MSTSSESGPPSGAPDRGWLANYTNPVVVLAVMVVFSLIVLIGAAVLGIDRGVLSGMARADYARGLITYLFAVTTIGIAVALVLSALTSANPSEKDTDIRLQRGKEILSLLLGVFGTIMGFYFGSEANKSAAPPFQVSSVALSPQPAAVGETITVRAIVTGGSAPVRFGVGQGSDAVEADSPLGDGGWIVKDVALAAPRAGFGSFIRLVVIDADGRQIGDTVPVETKGADQP